MVARYVNGAGTRSGEMALGGIEAVHLGVQRAGDDAAAAAVGGDRIARLYLQQYSYIHIFNLNQSCTFIHPTYGVGGP